MSDDSLIASLVRDKMALEAKLSTLAEKHKVLEAEYKGLLNASDKWYRKEAIAAYVQALFKEGKIPLPETVSAQKLPVKVVCRPEEISFSQFGIRVPVEFLARDMIRVPFELTPTPLVAEETTGRHYPGFHLQYKNPQKKPKKKIVPKPVKAVTPGET